MIGVRNTTKIASISLDIRKNNAVNNDPIVLRQGDSDVIIEASISNDGYPDLGINFATFVAKKPDGTIISNDPANVSGNVISYPISKHLTESVGQIQGAYFMINNEVTTNGFDISVIPSTQLDDTSVNYIPGIENINKFLESAETDWLGRIQQMKTQIDGLNIPDEFKLLMDKALSDAKDQYQPTIDAAEENVENIVADLAAKKLDLQNNSDELNQTITTIKAQVASINSFLDSVQKQIIEANSSFTAGQQAQISQSIADGQKQIIAANASFTADQQAKVSQSIADLKAQIDALTVAKTGPKGDKGDKGDVGPQGPKGNELNFAQYSGKTVPDAYKDLNTFPVNSEVLITDNIGNLKNVPSQLVGTSYAAAISTESVGNNDSGTIQKLFVVDTNDFYERLVWGGENSYQPWKLLANGYFYKPGKMITVETGSPYDDLNTFPIGQTVTIAETLDKIKQIKNLPPISDTTGGLTVRTDSSVNDTIGGTQIAIDNNNVIYHRICWGASGQWGAWKSDSVDEQSNTSNILPTLSLFQKVGVVGDSYASGELAFDGQYVDHYEISWLQILARKDGFIGTNFSKGGMSTRTWLTNSNCMPLMQSSDAQELYILALGINDEALGTSYIGSEADIDSGADTFYGNYGKIIKAIQAKSPQAKLVTATIADNSDIATKFNEAITTIASHFTIPVIVQLDDPLFNSSFYKDTMIGGHPTGPVYASMAEAFERLIGQSMIDHLDYYKTFKK